MTFELVPDRCSNEIGAIRVEPFLNHQIDVTKVDITKIDRDFLCFRRLGSKFPDISCHNYTIHIASVWMVYGCLRYPFKGLLILMMQQPTVQNEFANSISAFNTAIRRSASLAVKSFSNSFG